MTVTTGGRPSRSSVVTLGASPNNTSSACNRRARAPKCSATESATSGSSDWLIFVITPRDISSRITSDGDISRFSAKPFTVIPSWMVTVPSTGDIGAGGSGASSGTSTEGSGPSSSGSDTAGLSSSSGGAEIVSATAVILGAFSEPFFLETSFFLALVVFFATFSGVFLATLPEERLVSTRTASSSPTAE